MLFSFSDSILISCSCACGACVWLSIVRSCSIWCAMGGADSRVSGSGSIWFEIESEGVMLGTGLSTPLSGRTEWEVLVGAFPRLG